MKQEDKEQFLKAMKEEIEAHTKHEHWTVIDKDEVPKGHGILKSVWSMKRKRRVATGEVYKWKARLCVDGSKQVHGINYWETYAPVVSWETVRSL